MYEIADRIVNATDLTSGDGLAALTEMLQYSQDAWDDRRANPRDDLVSRYAHAVVDGREPEYAQFVMDFQLIFTAAGDTTRNAIGGGMRALFENPDQHDLIRRDPGVLDTAVEEILRWTTPVTYMRRTAAEDTEIGGQEIKAGDKVANFFAAANRDRRVFPDPLRFDVRRTPNNHVAFGFGPHFCLGSHLARLEMRVLFRELMRRLPNMEPTRAGVPGRLYSSMDSMSSTLSSLDRTRARARAAASTAPTVRATSMRRMDPILPWRLRPSRRVSLGRGDELQEDRRNAQHEGVVRVGEAKAARIPLKNPAVRFDQMAHRGHERMFAQLTRPVRLVTCNGDRLPELFGAQPAQLLDAGVDRQDDRREVQIGGVVRPFAHDPYLRM